MKTIYKNLVIAALLALSACPGMFAAEEKINQSTQPECLAK